MRSLHTSSAPIRFLGAEAEAAFLLNFPGGYPRGSQDPWKRTQYVTFVSGPTSWVGKEGKPHYQFTPPGRFPTIPHTPHRGS